MAKQSKKEKWKIAVIDFETDPFKFDREPVPFAAGFYDGEIYKEFWGDDCVIQLIIFLESLKTPHRIYAHNGGKFDFFFFLKHDVIQNPALIINGRIVRARFMGIHEIRDSYAILPLPLAKMGAKLEIDYSKMERDVREKHKREILDYMKPDCVELWKLIDKFTERFGTKVTIGGTAISEIRKFHTVSKQDKKHDEQFRPFYFGGRVECFEAGEIKIKGKKKLKIIDVNSMYPAAMRNAEHPSGAFYINLGKSQHHLFNHKTGKFNKFGGMYFMRFRGANKNAIPVRDQKTKGLSFSQEYGEFYACSHEIEVACELNLIRIDEILEVFIPCTTMNFSEFVDKYGDEKVSAKVAGDFITETFTKLILNSGYGKYATDPEKFKEIYLLNTLDHDQLEDHAKWCEKFPDAEMLQDMGQYEIWQCKAINDERSYFDVAVAASITSKSRAILLRAIYGCIRPLYCDTDSLICQDVGDVELHDSKLGAWKLEGETDLIYIAGKKMYACYMTDSKNKTKLKIASKGAKLNYEDIKKLCDGETVHWKNDAPNFKLNGVTKFVSRNIRKII
jgi:hypothetical protein